jgi:hypothetical protein
LLAVEEGASEQKIRSGKWNEDLSKTVDQRLMVEVLVEAEQSLVKIKEAILDPTKTQSERDSLIKAAQELEQVIRRNLN